MVVDASTSAGLARFIEHTLLAPEATGSDVQRLAQEAQEFGFYGVCVASANVHKCRLALEKSDVRVIATVGFPLGSVSSSAKEREAEQALEDGADELDMVIQLGALKGRDYACVFEDLRRVVRVAAPHPVKAILETASLERDEKLTAAAIAVAAGVAFLKTSTGFGAGGATVGDVQLLRSATAGAVGIKASGGIRTAIEAEGLVAAGATRLGTSRSVGIVTGDVREPMGY